MRRCLLLLLAALLSLGRVHAQPVIDTTLTWQGYTAEGRCEVEVYLTPLGTKQSHTVIVREVAQNTGPSTLDDVRYVVERIGRHLALDPTAAFWVFHWGPFSFLGADLNHSKDVFLRATFRRTSTRTLGQPTWRLWTEDDLLEATDRFYQADP